LELSSLGRIVVRLGLGLLLVGSLSSNPVIVLSTAALFLFLLIEGIVFHHAVGILKISIRLESHPPYVEGSVGRTFRVETVIKNPSNLSHRIIALNRNLPPQIREEQSPTPIPLVRSIEQKIETLLQARAPGKFEILSTTISLESRSRLFKQLIEFPDKVTIMARPLVSRPIAPFETDVFEDLTIDRLRRGTGTDFAGVRELSFLDDSHRIDWKATARTGKLMTREFYLERDPPIMLVVDASSSMKDGSNGISTLSAIVSEAANLLAAIPASNPLGLILYDDRDIVSIVNANLGFDNREQVLHILLEETNVAPKAARVTSRIIPHHEAATIVTHALMTEFKSSKLKPQFDKLNSFVALLSLYHAKARSKSLERLQRQGSYAAFERVSQMREPLLVLAISDCKTNCDGLLQGAKRVTEFDHRVVLAVVADRMEATSQRKLVDLEAFGVRVVRCNARGLSKAVGEAIHELSRARAVPAALRT